MKRETRKNVGRTAPRLAYQKAEYYFDFWVQINQNPIKLSV